jgi:hypothetical protein
VTSAYKGEVRFSYFSRIHRNPRPLKCLIYAPFAANDVTLTVEQQLSPDSAQHCTKDKKLFDFIGLATPAGIEPATFSLEGTDAISGFLKP